MEASAAPEVDSNVAAVQAQGAAPTPSEDALAIRELRGRFADAANLRHFDAFVDLFTEDGVWEVPDLGVSFTGRDALRQGIERMLGQWEFFVQNVHDGFVAIEGDHASGRSYVNEIARPADGNTGHLNFSVYDEELVRTANGWRFARRTYHFLYLDESPLAGRGMELPDLAPPPS